MSVWKLVVAAVGSGLVLASCGGGGGTSDSGSSGCTPKGAGSGTASQTVKVLPDPNTVGKYEPQNITVKVGQTIQWDWQDSGAQHSVTSDDNTTFDSCLLSAGAKFTVTFSKPGDFKYHCIIHAQMIGDIKVS